MSLFGTILSKIFPSSHPAVAANQQAQQGGQSGTVQSAAPGQQTQAGGMTGGMNPGAQTQAPQTGAMQQVDVEQVLNQMAQKNAEKLNWRTSIVDLMKLVGMDSSLSARKSLAQELNYTGDMNDSATMNIWLQKQVMKKLADNGGKVPEDLKH